MSNDNALILELLRQKTVAIVQTESQFSETVSFQSRATLETQNGKSYFSFEESQHHLLSKYTRLRVTMQNGASYTMSTLNAIRQNGRILYESVT